MTKTDKKIDKSICQALTIACETAKENVSGFKWLTHLVDYNCFPDSLAVICIFDTEIALEQAKQQMKVPLIISLIKTELEQKNIKLKNMDRQVLFDTEESCFAEHKGNWRRRFELFDLPKKGA